MKKLSQYFHRIRSVLSSLDGRRWLMVSLKVWVLTFSDFLKMPKQNWLKKGTWRQISYQRLRRSPEVLAAVFSRTLRVCLTYKCNLDCRYCYAKGMKNDFPKDMSPKEFLELINWMKEKGWRCVRFLGGEPTFHPQFSEILDICYRNKVFFSISTNNTFPLHIGLKLDKQWLMYVTVHYVYDTLDNKRKAIFKDNLRQLSQRNIPFEISYIIGYHDNNWLEIFEMAKLYKPVVIRVSIEVPGLAKQMSSSGLVDNFRLIAKRIFDFQKNCLKQNIPFYILRPLASCMFFPKEWENLKGTFPFVCYTRCPLGAMGDYSQAVVVNPDLSVFPCIAVFLKGPNIFNFKDKKEISDFYKTRIKQMLSEPFMELCKSCEKHNKFVCSLEKGANSDLKSTYDEGICQAGCLSFNKSSQMLCCIE